MNGDRPVVPAVARERRKPEGGKKARCIAHVAYNSRDVGFSPVPWRSTRLLAAPQAAIGWCLPLTIIGPDTEVALASVRVLEVGSLIAGPFAGRILAEFGADVIKVEAPDTPDPLRTWGNGVYRERALYW